MIRMDDNDNGCSSNVRPAPLQPLPLVACEPLAYNGGIP